MRKNSASGVIASLRGSTYGLGKRLFRQAMGGRVRGLAFLSCPAWRFNAVSHLDIHDGFRSEYKFVRSLLGSVGE